MLLCSGFSSYLSYAINILLTLSAVELQSRDTLSHNLDKAARVTISLQLRNMCFFYCSVLMGQQSSTKSAGGGRCHSAVLTVLTSYQPDEPLKVQGSRHKVNCKVTTKYIIKMNMSYCIDWHNNNPVVSTNLTCLGLCVVCSFHLNISLLFCILGMTEHSTEPGTSKQFLPLSEVLIKLYYLLGSHCLRRYDMAYSNFFVSDAEQENKPLTLLTSVASSIFLFLVGL
jgi:hypothetical protein